MRIIKLECPYCHSPLNVKPKKQKVICDYCGSVFYVDDDTIRISKNIHRTVRDEGEIHRANAERDIKMAKLRFKQEKHRNKIRLILLGVILYIAISLFFAMMELFEGGYEIVDDFFYKHKVENMAEEGMFSAGNSRDYINENYKGVVSQLKAAGFKNVKKVNLNDVFFLSDENSKVVSVSINGNSDFVRNDFWDGSEKVVVTYH
ncbi:MAG: hypothetical protein K6E91_01350 [Butyrivibrio sp.]|nr:hypothetical protein [Butyrivibrio sp.]